MSWQWNALVYCISLLTNHFLFFQLANKKKKKKRESEDLGQYIQFQDALICRYFSSLPENCCDYLGIVFFLKRGGGKKQRNRNDIYRKLFLSKILYDCIVHFEVYLPEKKGQGWKKEVKRYVICSPDFWKMLQLKF